MSVKPSIALRIDPAISAMSIPSSASITVQAEVFMDEEDRFPTALTDMISVASSNPAYLSVSLTSRTSYVGDSMYWDQYELKDRRVVTYRATCQLSAKQSSLTSEDPIELSVTMRYYDEDATPPGYITETESFMIDLSGDITTLSRVVGPDGSDVFAIYDATPSPSDPAPALSPASCRAVWRRKMSVPLSPSSTIRFNPGANPVAATANSIAALWNAGDPSKTIAYAAVGYTSQDKYFLRLCKPTHDLAPSINAAWDWPYRSSLHHASFAPWLSSSIKMPCYCNKDLAFSSSAFSTSAPCLTYPVSSSSEAAGNADPSVMWATKNEIVETAFDDTPDQMALRFNAVKKSKLVRADASNVRLAYHVDVALQSLQGVYSVTVQLKLAIGNQLTRAIVSDAFKLYVEIQTFSSEGLPKRSFIKIDGNAIAAQAGQHASFWSTWDHAFTNDISTWVLLGSGSGSFILQNGKLVPDPSVIKSFGDEWLFDDDGAIGSFTFGAQGSHTFYLNELKSKWMVMSRSPVTLDACDNKSRFYVRVMLIPSASVKDAAMTSAFGEDVSYAASYSFVADASVADIVE